MSVPEELEPIPVDRAEHVRSSPRWSWALLAGVGGALVVAGFAIGLQSRETRATTVVRHDVRGPLIVVNPCPVDLDAELRDDTGRTRWGGTLQPGVNLVEHLAAMTVTDQWSVEYRMPGGRVSIRFGKWFGVGTATIPAMSCPSS